MSSTAPIERTLDPDHRAAMARRRTPAASPAPSSPPAPSPAPAQLAAIVSEAQGPAALRHAIHPATRTFQALRIHVNDELGELERGLEAALNDSQARKAAWRWCRSTAWKTASSSSSSPRARLRAARLAPLPPARAAHKPHSSFSPPVRRTRRRRDCGQSPSPLRQAARRRSNWRHRRSIMVRILNFFCVALMGCRSWRSITSRKRRAWRTCS